MVKHTDLSLRTVVIFMIDLLLRSYHELETISMTVFFLYKIFPRTEE
jgi:hypothetical protein